MHLPLCIRFSSKCMADGYNCAQQPDPIDEFKRKQNLGIASSSGNIIKNPLEHPLKDHRSGASCSDQWSNADLFCRLGALLPPLSLFFSFLVFTAGEKLNLRVAGMLTSIPARVGPVTAGSPRRRIYFYKLFPQHPVPYPRVAHWLLLCHSILMTGVCGVFPS